MRILRHSSLVVDISAAIVVGTAFCLPMILSRSAFFGDWQYHLYLLAKQASYVGAHLTPTYFLNTEDRGWFYPFYAFYGGTLYYVAAVFAVLVRSAWAVYVGSYVVGFAAAYAGWTWIARQAGLCGSLALLPGLVHVSGAYYITNAYGRGAWPEFIATSAVPLTLAAAWSVLTSHTIGRRAVVVLASSVVILTGSHIITMIFSLPLVAIALAMALAITRPSSARPLRLVFTGLVAALALCLNAWFLAPLLAYRDTLAVRPAGLAYRQFDTLDVIFGIAFQNPLAHATPQLFVQAPTVPLFVSVATILIGMLLVRDWHLVAYAVLAQLGFGLVLWLITGATIWTCLPTEAQIVQFPYRLNSNLLICITALTVIAGRYASCLQVLRPRLGATLLAALVAAVVIQCGIGQYQIWIAQTFGPADRLVADLTKLPRGFYDAAYFNLVAPTIYGPYTEVRWTSADLDVSAIEFVVPAQANPALARTNVVFSPLIAVEPPNVAGVVGGYVVLGVPPSAVDTPFVVRSTLTPAVIAGRVLTLVGAVGAAGTLCWLFWHRRASSVLSGAGRQSPEPVPAKPRGALASAVGVSGRKPIRR